MPRLKASVSICVKMVYAHKESAEVVALVCCCLRYLKIRECRPYPSVPVLVCAPGFARENKKTFFSLRLPCLFDRSNYPPNHPPQRFLQSLSVKRLALAIKFQVTSTYSLTLSGFAFAIACCWSIFAPWWKPHNLPELPFCLRRSFLPYLNRIQLLRRGKFFVASTCFAQSTIITKSFSKVRVSHSDDTRFLATVVKISSTSGVVKPSRTLSASFSPLFLLVNKYC